jgi:hypothetical protein
MILNRMLCHSLYLLALFSSSSHSAIDLACKTDCGNRGYDVNYCNKACTYHPISRNATNEGYTPDAKWDDLNKQLNNKKELKLPTQEIQPLQLKTIPGN